MEQTGCGKCGACRANIRTDWTLRLHYEAMSSKNTYFITLTYNDDNLPMNEYGEMTLEPDDLQKFWKRLRKHEAKHQGKSHIRHYSIGEYGTRFKRPHYHALIFNISLHSLKSIREKWGLGHIRIDPTNPARIHYVTKYHILKNNHASETVHREFTHMSTKPGIGSNYIDLNGKYHRENLITYVMKDNYKLRLPRFYKDRIFNHDQKITIKTYAKLEHQEREKQEFNRLENLGIKNITEYIMLSRLHKAKIVKFKQIETDLQTNTF